MFRALYEGTSIGKKEGYKEGLSEGTENAIKSFITGGDRQIFVTKKNIYPFGNVDNLFENEDITNHIRDFILEPSLSELKTKENRLNELNRIIEDTFQNEIENLNTSAKDYSSKLKSKKGIKSKALLDVESRIEYLTNTPRKELILNEMNRLEEKINNNRKLIKGANMSTPLDEFAMSNKKLVELYDENAQSSPNKTLAKQINTRNKIQNLYERYSTFNETNKLLGEIEELKQNINNLSQPYKLKQEFAKKRKGDYSIFLSDNFNIYNIQNIQKLYPKNIENVHNRIEKNKEYKLNLANIVSDYRTNKIEYEDLADYIKIPTFKLQKRDVFDELVKQKFNNNIPADVEKFVLALRSQKK